MLHLLKDYLQSIQSHTYTKDASDKHLKPLHSYTNFQSNGEGGTYTCSYEYTFEETTHTESQITEYDERGVLKYYKRETDGGEWGKTYEITGPSYEESSSISSFPIENLSLISLLGIVSIIIAKKWQQ